MNVELASLDRVIAFIDVLGFSAWISDESQDIESLGYSYVKIFDVFEDVVIREDRRPKHGGAAVEFTYFSDSVVLSCPRSEPRAEHIILEKSRYLAERFLLHGLVCRGGVAYGPVYHADRIVFGKGMLDAYYLESKVASYPRIVVDENIASEILTKEQLYGLDPSLCISDSGLYFLDIFGPMVKRGRSEQEKLVQIGRAIGRSLWKERRRKRPDIIAKWTWIKNYYNKSAKLLLPPELLIPDEGFNPSDKG